MEDEEWNIEVGGWGMGYGRQSKEDEGLPVRGSCPEHEIVLPEEPKKYLDEKGSLIAGGRRRI